MKSCEKIFWCNSLRSLKYLKNNMELSLNMELHDIFAIIKRHINFTIRDHTGPIRPEYYCGGIPSLIWKCEYCKNVGS